MRNLTQQVRADFAEQATVARSLDARRSARAEREAGAGQRRRSYRVEPLTATVVEILEARAA